MAAGCAAKPEAPTAPPRPLTPAELDAREPGRGRCARSPLAIPLLGWKDIFWRTYREMGRDRLTALSGGVTFYILLATFPAIAAFVSLYGLFSDVGTVERQLTHISTLLPPDAVSLIGSQMLRLATQRHATLSAAFVISTLLSVWSANAGMKALFDGLNITFDETEKRDYVHRSLRHLRRDAGGAGVRGLVAGVLIAAPVFFHGIGLRRFGVWWGPVRWLTVFLIVDHRLHACSIATAPAAGTRNGAGWCSAGCWRRWSGWRCRWASPGTSTTSPTSGSPTARWAR